MKINRDLLPINDFSRPGDKMEEVLGLVFHWTGNAGQKNEVTGRYFELLANQPHDKKHKRYASAHYIIGMDGEILQVIPEDEVAYHVGAWEYTPFAVRHFPDYTTNVYHGSPNWCLIGVELCHPDWSGQFTKETLISAKKLAFDIGYRHRFIYGQIHRHYDITGKRCPLWMVEHPDDWEKFIRDIDYMKQFTR